MPAWASPSGPSRWWRKLRRHASTTAISPRCFTHRATAARNSRRSRMPPRLTDLVVRISFSEGIEFPSNIALCRGDPCGRPVLRTALPAGRPQGSPPLALTYAVLCRCDSLPPCGGGLGWGVVPLPTRGRGEFEAPLPRKLAPMRGAPTSRCSDPFRLAESEPHAVTAGLPSRSAHVADSFKRQESVDPFDTVQAPVKIAPGIASGFNQAIFARAPYRPAIVAEGMNSHLFARAHVPQTQRSVGASRHNPRAVRRKGAGPNRTLMPLEGQDAFARARVPQTQRSVVASRHNPRAVRRKGAGPNRTLMPLEGQDAFARARVPQTQRSVVASRHNPRAVRRKGAGVHAAGVPNQPFEMGPHDGVFQFQRGVSQGCRQVRQKACGARAKQHASAIPDRP